MALSSDPESSTGATHRPREATSASSSANATVTSDSLDTALCLQCREIFPKLRECLEKPDEKAEPQLITKYGKVCLAISSDCKLCSLVTSMAHMADDADAIKAGYSLLGINLLNSDEMGRAQSYSKESYVGGILVVKPSAPSTNLGSRILLREKGLIMMLSTGTYSVRAISDQSFNIAVAKKWIQDCEDSHKCCKVQSSAVLKRMRVVDCHKGEVVEHCPGEPYVALSYVWGRHYQDTKNEKSDFKSLEDCPSTILDAMHVTKKLGYAFLWVDRYCIDQSDATKKLAQIANMDVIYEHAKLTIVAGAGKHDQYGIPGAGSPRSPLRVRQPTTQIGGLSLASSMPDIVLALKKSKWASRGWTYQEAILSRRCLVFLPDQVYFLCRSICRSESLPVLPKLRLGERHLRTVFHDYYGKFTKVPPPSRDEFNDQELLTHIEMYTKRLLTHDSDALDAFSGILKRCDCYSFWGVPVVSGLFPVNVDPHAVSAKRENPDARKNYFTDDIALGFLWGLMWRTKRKRAKMRSGFPSWSWLAMKDTGIRHDFRHDNFGTILHTSSALGVDEAHPGIWFGDPQQDSWTSISEWSEMVDERKSSSRTRNALLLEASIARVTRIGFKHSQPNVYIESRPNSESGNMKIESGAFHYDSSAYLPVSFQAKIRYITSRSESDGEDISDLSWIVLALIHDDRRCSMNTVCLVLQKVGDNEYRRIGTTTVLGHRLFGPKEKVIVV